MRPLTAAVQVVATVRAELPPLAAVEVQVQGQVGVNATAPAVFAGGIVNTASYGQGEGLAPGSIVAVFGRNLAQGENRAAHVPLETSLGGVTVSVGGVDAPLFYSSDGQVNAQLPSDLAPNSRATVVVRTTRANGAQAFTVPETITIAGARPAIFTTNQQGTGQGAILNQDNSPNAAANPAARGSVIQIFATGLGATTPAVASGQAAPADPPAQVTIPVEVRIAGRTVTPQFAGLAPGFDGVPSNTATVAVQ